MAITRYAIFSGELKKGQEKAMREWVSSHLTPLWRQFACAEEVRVLYSVEQDKNGPAIPMILAITYQDEDAMQRGLDSPARYESRDLLTELYDKFFDDITLWHYTMDREQFFD